MWACLVPPGLEPLSGRIGASYATLGDLILIRVLYPGLFPQDCTCDWADDAPLETVANRSAPMAGGPTWTRPDQGRVGLCGPSARGAIQRRAAACSGLYGRRRT
jgi:hypothetical protein